MGILSRRFSEPFLLRGAICVIALAYGLLVRKLVKCFQKLENTPQEKGKVLVVHRLDNGIHWIILYRMDGAVCFPITYLLFIQLGPVIFSTNVEV